MIDTFDVDTRRFDVFLSYHHADESAVKAIAERLRKADVQPWFDRWHLTAGDPWQPELAQALRISGACAVFIGPQGLGDWARQELAVAQDRAAHDRHFRLFMVLLPGAPELDDPNLAFLRMRTWVDLRAGIANSGGLERLISAITGAPRSLTPLVTEDQDVCPYRGLEVFDEAHAEFFFGREDDTARVLEKLKVSRFLAVLGPSGSGKSSLVRAGVVPALRQGTLAGSQDWTIRIFTPGVHPLTALATQIGRLYSGESMQATLDQMHADGRTVDLAVSLALSERDADERVMLVVDQFEELFSLCKDEDQRRAFLTNLTYAATIPGGRLVVLVALRADFYHHCAAYPELRVLVADQQYLVGPLGPEGLRRVISEPARRVGLELEAGLVETILADVVERPGALPLLEHALFELWEARQNHLLTLGAYVTRGGTEGALAQRADATYQSLTPGRQQIARRIFLRLTQPGEGTEDTRHRASMAELFTSSEDQEDLDAVIKALADRRLLTTGRDELTGAAAVELAHEALIRAWPTLQTWINEDRDALRAHRRLSEAASDWNQASRDEELLYRGSRLAYWTERDPSDLNNLERSFLDASRQRQQREHAAARRRVRLGVGGLSLALVLISVVAIVALVQRNRANASALTERSRQLAASARDQLPIDPERSLLLALEAFKTKQTAQAEAILRQATLDSRVRARFEGHQGGVWGVSFSSDGRWAVSGSDDAKVRVWDWANGGKPVILRGHQGIVWDVAFSPDGRRVVSVADDATVRVWDWAAGSEPVILRGHEKTVWGVAFSPDGWRVVSAGNDATVRVWDWAGLSEPVILRGHEGVVREVAFSRDGRRVVSVGDDATVRVWDWAAGSEPVVLRGHEGIVWDVAFSPDGRRVVSAAYDATLRVWDWAAGSEPVALMLGGQDRVWGVAFSPDGRRVLSADRDATLRVWDWAGLSEPVILRGHENGGVRDVALSPDGRQVASAGDDGTLRVWDWAKGGEPVVLRGRGEAVLGVAFSPDGRRVVSAGSDGTLRVWDWAKGGEPVVRRGRGGGVWDAAFSPDGRRVVGGSDDGTVRVWDWADSSEPVVLRGHQGRVLYVAFSLDGRRVVSASYDAMVRVWDWAGGSEPAVLVLGNQSRAGDVAFSPDGRRVVSVSSDATVRVWKCDVCGPIKDVLRLARQRITRQLSPEERQAFLNEPRRRWAGLKIVRRAGRSSRRARVPSVTSSSAGSLKVWCSRRAKPGYGPLSRVDAEGR